MTMPSIDQVARVCHEANGAWRDANYEQPQLSWDDAPQWQRVSCHEGVEKAMAGASPEELHESWLAFKVADGWVFGEVKDPDAKTHPCLVPYEELPEDQRRKDALFSAIVKALTE